MLGLHVVDIHVQLHLMKFNASNTCEISVNTEACLSCTELSYSTKVLRATALYLPSKLASVALTHCRRNEENFYATCGNNAVKTFNRDMETKQGS